jgi:hypothetical protein
LAEGNAAVHATRGLRLFLLLVRGSVGVGVRHKDLAKVADPRLGRPERVFLARIPHEAADLGLGARGNHVLVLFDHIFDVAHLLVLLVHQFVPDSAPS